jgi:hypothetical protein
MDVLFVLATVAVAQLVEPWIVIPVVVGSSPISHPNPQKSPCTKPLIPLVFKSYSEDFVFRWHFSSKITISKRSL